MRFFFALTTTLCWLNAALLCWDMLSVPNPVYVVSLTLILVFFGCGWVVHRIQYHLFRGFDAVAALGDDDAAAIMAPLVQLRMWLIVLAVAVTFVTLLSLTGIVSRFREGVPLFG